MTTSITNPLIKSRNYLINPNFKVIQKTASGTLANSLALPTQSLGYLGGTNWFEAASGGTPAYAYSSANQSATFTGAASTTAIHFGQRIKAKDANDLRNKTVTLSAYISNSLLTTVTWTLYRPTTTDDVHGTVGTPTQTQIATGTFTVTSALTRYSTVISLPDEVSKGLEIRFSVGAQTSGTWVLSRIQLEEGSTATDFNCDDEALELAKCLRFFELISGGGVYAIAPTGGTAFPAINRVNSETPISLVSFAEKSTTPSISFPTNGSARYVHSSGIYTSVTVAANSVTNKNFVLSGNTAPVSGYGWIDNVGDIYVSAHIP